MEKMNRRTILICVVILILAALTLGGYYMLKRQAQKKASHNTLPTTEVGKVLAKDLDTKYPATPTEVVKLYWRIVRCIYNDASEEELDSLLDQLCRLYDDEFLAQEENSRENMLAALKSDKEKREEAKQIFSAYVVQKNNSVETREIEKGECATVASSILIKAKGKSTKTYEQFMLRKDTQGKWKILGWKQIDANTAADAGVE